MITLKYSEESDESQHPKRKYDVKNMLVYDGKGENDFEFKVSGERITHKFTGAQISEGYPNVTHVSIVKDFDGLIIEYIDDKQMVHKKVVIRDYAFDYFELKNVNIKKQKEKINV